MPEAPKVPAEPLLVRPEPPSAPTVAAPEPTFNDIEVIDEAAAEQAVAVVQPKKQRWHWNWKKLNPKTWTKKQAIIISIIAVLVIAGGGSTAYALLHTSKKPVAQAVAVKPKVAPKPIVITSPLTGAVVPADQAKWPVTGIMVENSPDARPQSGLDKAGVVFEAVAEGGITRFLALYQEGNPDYVGPIRSARPYYVNWLLGFNASLAHVGGSPEALGNIKSQNVRDLDQFANGSSYTRISSRAAPHNVYTSLQRLRDLEASKGYSTSSFTSWPRKKDAPVKQPTASSIDFSISSSLYNAHYDYNAASNSYERSEGGKPHMVIDSAGNQTQINPKVVISLVMAQSLEADGSHTVYNTFGSGTADIFQDGTVTTGSWHKADATSQFSFTDSTGKTIALNAGQTWLSVVGSSSSVSYK